MTENVTRVAEELRLLQPKKMRAESLAILERNSKTERVYEIGGIGWNYITQIMTSSGMVSSTETIWRDAGDKMSFEGMD